MLKEHKTLIFSDGFSFENKDTAELMKKTENEIGAEVAVYNVDLDNRLKDCISEKSGKGFPILYVDGQVKEL